MIKVTTSGDFSKAETFLARMKKRDMFNRIDACCQQGVIALSRATPIKSGKTANSWSYEIKSSSDGLVVYWTNDHIVNGFNVAIGLQYGHGTGWGGYVKGIDYINPAIAPVFNKIADDIWQEVTRI